ncbi:DUF3237 domain-containing protein [Pseudomonas oryzihabitans]|jgi:hypothetical protein|uniref:UPF0311 protein BVL52_03990 n=1 Tax=Pseudomonas oryzihabitans TaxID=47885 RepID=A0A1G5MM12_9PSED|nr:MULTISPECIES: DUF3237 domain-containing protein [Pseudomonas]MDU4055905.1 DUF3237 domain-containing protein [Pseudomonas oryzihabitans]NMY88063.1 DUF3237 domain-containing protein [Pseudomonas psychrotolerans]NMZ45003.1 DUF3237 domain-containing protein [Pseudomonas oryzihabitans]NMZ65934.1 DUF3237 domain-containing protein [Pseudomonas oryzihabitans]ONN72953.1 hypothetical protein BVL52_03990 [Pseudomonas psychrotolerans]
MRSLLLVTLLTLTGLARAATTDGDPATATPPPLQLEPLARFEVALDAPVWELGQTSDLGKRRIIPITGGRFDGQRLHGRILDNGADWQVVTADGLAIIDTRYLLQTDDGALIYLQTKGYRYGPPEVMRELAAGKPVDPRRYFFRVTLTFETAAPAYAWLNRALGVGSAMRLGKAVVYDAYLLQ